MPNITPVPSGYITPARGLSAAEVKALFFDNDQGVRLLTYGARDPEGASPPHDHEEDGGVLLGYALLEEVYGPQGPEDGSGTEQIGIPLGRRASGSHGDIPKLVASHPLPLPGGVRNLDVYLLVRWDGTDAGADIALGVAIGTLAMTNYHYGTVDAGGGTPGQTKKDGVVTTGSAAYGVIVLSFEDGELDQLGDVTRDRVYELRVFQHHDPGVGKVHRLCGILAVNGDDPQVRSAYRGEPDRAELVVADFLSGAGVLTPDLALKIKRSENQQAVAILGGAPGLRSDGARADRRRPWTQTITAVHGHTGAFVPLGGGLFKGDGAILRRKQVARCYARNLGDNSSYVVDGDPYRGILLHPNGGDELDSEWLELRYRVAVGAGQASIRVRAALQVEADDKDTIVILRAVCTPISGGGGTIVTGIRTPTFSAHQVDADGALCELAPEDNDAFRAGAPWGQWGLLKETEVPAGVETTYPVQISEEAEIFLTHPALRSSDTAHTTGDYELTLRLEVMDKDSGVYDAEARLAWLLVLPGRG
jgi:hypothetical protein